MTLCQTFNLVECGVFAFDFGRIALTPRGMTVVLDSLRHLLRRQTIAFNLGRIVR